MNFGIAGDNFVYIVNKYNNGQSETQEYATRVDEDVSNVWISAMDVVGWGAKQTEASLAGW